MVFNRLELVNGQLVVDIDVSTLAFYDNAVIESITLDTLDSYSEDTGRQYTLSDRVLKSKSELLVATLSPNDFDAGGSAPDSFGDIVYVTVTIEGKEKVFKPCDIQPEFNGVAVNWEKIYRQGMSYVDELSSDCSNYRNFLDWSLRLKGFKLAVSYGDMLHASRYFKEWFLGERRKTGKCGCGR